MINEENTTTALSTIMNGAHEPAPQMNVVASAAQVEDAIERERKIYDIAAGLSNSSMVPEVYRGKRGSLPYNNAYVAISMGFALGLHPFQALSHIVIVAGKPTLDGQLAIAVANERAPIRGPIRYKEGGKGDEQFCTAWAVDRETGDRVEYTLTIADARKAGWLSKGHSHWNRDPKLMLRYRSATYLIRTNYPNALMGLYTRDEMEDVAQINAERSNSAQVSDIKSKLSILDGPVPEEIREQEEISSEQAVNDESGDDPSGEVVE